MTPFQGIAITCLAVILLFELRKLLSTQGRRGFTLVRCTLWLAAAVFIAVPHWASNMAGLVGIQRGADLVLYVVALSFLATTFYFYARNVRLQRQITEIVRHIAISEAGRGGAENRGQE